MLGDITTKLAAHGIRMYDLTSHVVFLGVTADVQPGPSNDLQRHPMIAVEGNQDRFHRMEEQVRCRITEHLRGVMPVYLLTTDDDSEADGGAPAQPMKKHKGTSGNLRTDDTTVVNQVIWPHELIYTPAGQPVLYKELISMAFVNGYLSVMALESQQVKVSMLAQLQDMMEDGEAYGWPIVVSYNAAWLQISVSPFSHRLLEDTTLQVVT